MLGDEDEDLAFGRAEFEVPMRHLKVNILQALRPMGLKCGEVPGLNIKIWRALACS